MGLVLFVLSYWLPSVKSAGHAGNDDALRGYACAAMAFVDLGDTFKDSALLGVCLLLADLANGLMIVWLLLRVTRTGRTLRRALAALTLIGALPCALVFLLNSEMAPIWGYFAWVLGMVLMTADDWRAPVAAIQPEEPV